MSQLRLVSCLAYLGESTRECTMALLSATQMGVDMCNQNSCKCAGVRMALYSFPAYSVCIVASKLLHAVSVLPARGTQ